MRRSLVRVVLARAEEEGRVDRVVVGVVHIMVSAIFEFWCVLVVVTVRARRHRAEAADLVVGRRAARRVVGTIETRERLEKETAVGEAPSPTFRADEKTTDDQTREDHRQPDATRTCCSSDSS